MDIGQGLASFGDSLAEGMQAYHKEHVAYDNADQMLAAFSRMGINEQGQLMPVMDAQGKAQKGITPIIDPSVIETLKAKVGTNRAKATGAMEALAKLGYATAGKVISSKIEDQSLSGQRTRQIMAQDVEKFPLEIEAQKASTERTKQIIQQEKEHEGKVDVPGFGLMTPSQKSAHDARILRMEALAKKSEPALSFENKLKTDYGIGAEQVIQATKGSFPAVDAQGKPVMDASGKPITYQGVPFVDATGAQVGVKEGKFIGPDGKPIEYDAKNPNIWAQVGPNKAAIPVHEWSAIVSKSKSMLPTIQAQQIISRVKLKDPDELTQQDKDAWDWAKTQLAQ